MLNLVLVNLVLNFSLLESGQGKALSWFSVLRITQPLAIVITGKALFSVIV
jgi:hypothetical protein